MKSFPRLASILLGALLLALIGITWWLMQAVETTDSLTPAPSSLPPAQTTAAPVAPTTVTMPSTADPPTPVFIDPVNEALAKELNAPEGSIRRDLEIVRDFIDLYRRAFGSNPIGLNEDITAAMTGAAGQKGRVFPPNSPAIRNGQLIDRWGSPFYFHPESGTKIEIRSAGPDKDLFTADDVLLQP